MYKMYQYLTKGKTSLKKFTFMDKFEITVIYVLNVKLLSDNVYC